MQFPIRALADWPSKVHTDYSRSLPLVDSATRRMILIADVDYLLFGERLFGALVGEIVGKRFMPGCNLWATVDVEEFHVGEQ